MFSLCTLHVRVRNAHSWRRVAMVNLPLCVPIHSLFWGARSGHTAFIPLNLFEIFSPLSRDAIGIQHRVSLRCGTSWSDSVTHAKMITSFLMCTSLSSVCQVMTYSHVWRGGGVWSQGVFARTIFVLSCSCTYVARHVIPGGDLMPSAEYEITVPTVESSVGLSC